jgi:Fe-S oxidoreductase
MVGEFKTIRKYKDILHKCLRCGFCKTTPNEGDFRRACPPGIWGGFEDYYSSGKPRIALGLLSGEIDWSPNLVNSIYSCTSCGACKELCIYDYSDYCVLVADALKAEAVEHGLIPESLKKVLKETYNFGNPWGGSRDNRSEWAAGLDIKGIKKGETDILYFAGCTVAYDIRNKEVGRALVTIFNKAGVRIGILGNEEVCCGSEMLKIGETSLFELLAEKNLETFEKYEIRKIVTSCPHAYNTLLNDPPYKGKIEVQHYTQFISELLEKGRLKLSKEIDKTVTYHDPCYLGRYNEVYDAPRRILEAIPGLNLVEMTRNRNNSFCCGGGGGRIWMPENPTDAPRVIRANETKEVDAEILATACPFCLMNLDDGIKTIEEEENIQVRDIAELVKIAI